MRRSIILDTVAGLAVPTILVVGLYLLLAGHNRPGGGFAGGLLIGAALVLRYATDGTDGVRAALPLAPEVVLGAGLLLSGGTGLVALLTGGALLSSAVWEGSLPLFGQVKVVSVLAFDVGVALVVVGLVLAALTALGPETVTDDEVGRA